MFYPVFLAPQGKPCPIITYNNGIYELPDELSNDLRRLENIRKVSKPQRMIAQCPVPSPPAIKILLIPAKNTRKIELFQQCAASHEN